jgi:hypothetical protein
MLRASAIDVPPTADNPPYILWETGGQTAAANLEWNPEFLKLLTETDIHSDTRIIIQGRDTYGQNIEAKVDIPAGTTSSETFIFYDTHTTPPMPVAFAYIDRIFQQNGTESTVVKIMTEPYIDAKFQVYLGTFHNASGFESGQAYPAWPKGTKYLVATGLHDPTHNIHPLATTQGFPVEPENPEMLKVRSTGGTSITTCKSMTTSFQQMAHRAQGLFGLKDSTRMETSLSEKLPS